MIVWPTVYEPAGAVLSIEIAGLVVMATEWLSLTGDVSSQSAVAVFAIGPGRSVSETGP